MRVTVFDWDDTIMATTHIFRHKKTKLPELGKSITTWLELALRVSNKVYIITNANKPWIKQCIKKYIPECTELIHQITIISTNELGLQTNKDKKTWKKLAFDIISNSFTGDEPHHLISFGDQPNDRMASIYLGTKVKNLIVKNILFTRNSTLRQLYIQQNYCCKLFPYLAKITKPVDVILEIS